MIKRNILDTELDHRKLIVADTQDQLRKKIESFEEMEKQMSDVYSSKKKLALTLVNEFKRPKQTIPLRFFTGKNKRHKFSEITDTLIKNIRKSKSFTDQERVYTHFKTKNEMTDDAEIIPYLGIDEVSSLEEILVTVAFLVTDDYRSGENSIYSKITADQERNLNVGYCILEDENGEDHVYVIYLERYPAHGNEGTHYHFHCQKIPRKYKKNRHMFSKNY